jgi:hypothetical protein
MDKRQKEKRQPAPLRPGDQAHGSESEGRLGGTSGVPLLGAKPPTGSGSKAQNPVPLESEGPAKRSMAVKARHCDEQFKRIEQQVEDARLRLSSAEPLLEKRVAELEVYVNKLLQDLAVREPAESCHVELFIVLVTGAITAPLGVLSVGESAPLELLKAAVLGAAGGGILIAVFIAGRMVEIHRLSEGHSQVLKRSGGL